MLMNGYEEAQEGVMCVISIFDTNSSGKVKLNEQLECLGITDLVFLLLLAVYYMCFRDPKVRQISYI